jgi:arylsulfatase
MQDPFERADITSNTFWDWNLNHVGSAYGMMDEVFQFVATFKDFPPRSFPPSFNPANVLDGFMDNLKTRKTLREGLDPEAARGALDRIINQQLESRGIR